MANHLAIGTLSTWCDVLIAEPTYSPPRHRSILGAKVKRFARRLPWLSIDLGVGEADPKKTAHCAPTRTIQRVLLEKEP